MRFKNFVGVLSLSESVFLALGICIVASTSMSTILGAEIEGTNPLSRSLQNSKSNSTPLHSPQKSKSSTKTRTKNSEILMQNISVKVNNVEISHSNHSKKTVSQSKPRMGKRRRFRIKQSSSSLQQTPESRPYYFHDFTSSENDRMKKSRQNIKKEEKDQSLNFDKDSQAESLRMKILSQLGSVDPLLCLPKALCGLASHYEEKNRIQTLHETKPTEISNNGVDYPNQASTTGGEGDWVNNYMELMKTFVPKSDNIVAKQKKRKPKVPWMGNDLDSSSSEESLEDDISSPEEEPLSQDDLDHFKEKARVEKWMKDEDYDPEPNWWDILPPHQPYQPLDEGPPQSSSHGESGGGGGSWSTLRISKGLSSFFTSMLPQVSFGFGKAPDVFADDPWFHDYKRSLGQGRSLGERSFSWLFGKKDSLGEGESGSGIGKNGHRTGRGSATRGGHHSVKGTKRNKNKVKNKNKNKNNDMNGRRRLRGGDLDMMEDDPMEKFQLAVEIGKQMEDPKQCDYVFTGCPFSYLEIIEIIESSNKSAEGEHKENQFHNLVSLGLINNATSTISHDLSTGNRLEISLKIDDKDLGTMIPLSSVLSRPDQRPTLSTMTTPPYPHSEKLSYLKPIPSEDNTGPISIFKANNQPTSPPPNYRTGLFENSEIAEDDSLESSLKPPTKPIPLRNVPPPPTPQVKTRPHKTRIKPSRPPPKRKQWGAADIRPVVVQLQPQRPIPPPPPPPPTIHRQQIHTHTKYKHIPMPTTINKPSHVINYHFHNTNSHPQVTHSGNKGQPQEMTLHSYPQAQPLTSPAPTTTPPTLPPPKTPLTITTTTTTTQPPLRFRDDFRPPRRPNKRRRRRRYKSPNKKITRRRRKPKPSKRSSEEEERIVIQLPEPTPPPRNNNNYYNLYPLLSNPPQGHQPMYSPQLQQSYPPPQQYHHNHYQHQHQPHHHNPPILSSQPYFIPQGASQGFQPQHPQTHPFYPNTPLIAPGIFSYILGKKK